MPTKKTASHAQPRRIFRPRLTSLASGEHASNRCAVWQLYEREIYRLPDGPAPLAARWRSLVVSPPFPLALAVSSLSLFTFIITSPSADRRAPLEILQALEAGWRWASSSGLAAG